ncbi:MAG: hypothetical protein KC561_13190, partial [Myxococcales bacterium]|nr:hypothetical protein [Myxococcales bacterium]
MRPRVVHKRVLEMAALALALSVLCGSASAQDRVFPYEGYLRVGGEAGGSDAAIAVPMRFTLYDTDGNAVWSEEYSDDGSNKSCDTVTDCSVVVRNGRFSVALGQYSSIGTLDMSADYFVGIELRQDGSWFDLDNRQRLAPVAWTFLSEEAENMAVDGDVTVLGNVDCNTTSVSAVDLRAGGYVDAGGPLTATSVVISGDAQMN